VGDIRAMGVSSGSFSAENGNAGGTLSGDLEYRPVSLNIGLSYRF
jgi:hypothetical protein